MRLRCRHAAFALLLLLSPLDAASAQRDTTVVAGPQYARGWMYRALFGTEYRRLWTTPLTVPLLDLRGYAGGLTPLSSGGGFQTKSLWLRGADGLMYGFRSVDKVLDVPEEIDSTFLADIARDQTSSQHPGAPAVAAALLDAAGVLHTEQQLVVIPDDPVVLDTFRLRFAGTLGFLERRALVEAGRPGFAGALEIVSSRTLLPRLFASPANRVDARAFLTARLTDVFLGDWDRHRGQWTWARMRDGPDVVWQPIPEDRDHAFVRFDGLLPGVGRHTAAPQLVEFGPGYASITGQTWNGRDIDRWFLNGLDRTVWDSVALWLQARLTDSVIDAAVSRLPPEWHALDGARLAAALKRRREGLPREAARFYAMLAREADVHATRAAEAVTIERLPEGRLAVRIAPKEPSGAPAYLARTFDPRETNEVRVYLCGGADRVVVRGEGPADVTLRVVGGGTSDLCDSSGAVVELLDSSRAGGVRLYSSGAHQVLAGRIEVDRRPWNPPREPRPGVPPPRDWGHRWQPTVWIGFGPDVGVFAGWGEVYTRYAFRELPYAARWRLRAGYATGATTGRVSVDGVVHRQNSAIRGELSLLASGIEVLRWYGIGNETARNASDRYHRVTQQRLAARAALVLPAGPRGRLAVGPLVAFNDTEDQTGRIIADSLPYGAGDFGHTGVFAEYALDTRDVPSAPLAGVTLTLGGTVFPGVWDVVRRFGEAHAEATAHLTARAAPLRPSLAMRAGGKRVFGFYPFHEAAFIGDAGTVRLGRQNRYGGDAAAYANAELRVRLGRAFVLLPGEIGLLALGDIGRVWVEGESSDTWHGATGGGVWLSLVRPSNVLSLAVAASKERTALYLGAGFAY
jgi:hypothetical protein